MAQSSYADYAAAEPYFQLVRGALGDLVDGQHFFDVVSDDIVYEVLYDLGWPRTIRGRDDLMAAFLSYGDSIELASADNLTAHLTDEGSVLVTSTRSTGPCSPPVCSTTTGSARSSGSRTARSSIGATTWTP